MEKKVQYTDQVNRAEIIKDNSTMTLVKEDNITEGNFLTFTDVKPLEVQLLELKDNQMTLMNGMVDIYMAQLGL